VSFKTRSDESLYLDMMSGFLMDIPFVVHDMCKLISSTEPGD